MIFCINCHETFRTYEDYSRHKWNEHEGDLDLGEKFM